MDEGMWWYRSLIVFSHCSEDNRDDVMPGSVMKNIDYVWPFKYYARRSYCLVLVSHSGMKHGFILIPMKMTTSVKFSAELQYAHGSKNLKIKILNIMVKFIMDRPGRRQDFECGRWSFSQKFRIFTVIFSV
jgi:hypothetical protein